MKKFKTDKVSGVFVSNYDYDFLQFSSNNYDYFGSTNTLKDFELEKLFSEVYPPILSMESPMVLKYKYKNFAYANIRDCFEDFLKDYENKHQLLSYNTIICEYNIDNGEFIMIYNNIGSTSRIHLTEFKKLYNIK